MKIKCPTCGNSTTWQENPDRPFCSERCRLIDLGKWATEDYRIPDNESQAAQSSGREEEYDG